MNINQQRTSLENELEEKYEKLEDMERELLSRFRFLSTNKLTQIDMERLKWWLGNFKNKNIHKFFALMVLDSVIYRNFDMLNNSFLRALSKEIKVIYEEINHVEYTIIDWLDKLETKSDVNIKFLGVNKDESTQSSNLILRNLNKIVHRDLIIKSESEFAKIYKTTSLIIILDDIIGSGKQFLEFYRKLLETYPDLETDKILYCPLMAMNKGIIKIKNSTIFQSKPIKIFPCEIITTENSIFNSEIIEKFKKFFALEYDYNFLELFKNMRLDFSHISKNAWLGRDKALLAIIYDWGCPNQTTAMIFDETREQTSSTVVGGENYYCLAERRGV